MPESMGSPRPFIPLSISSASQVALVIKNLLANAADISDVGSIPGSGRSPGGEHGNPLQYSCLENPMDRGTWHDMVHRVAKSRTRLKQLSIHFFIHYFPFLSMASETLQLFKGQHPHTHLELISLSLWQLVYTSKGTDSILSYAELAVDSELGISSSTYPARLF